MRRWRRFWALNTAQRGLVLWSIAFLPVVTALLRRRGFGAAQAFIGRMPVPRTRHSPEEAARMVDAAASLVGASCVPRSLVLWRLARAKGATIRFGVARPSPRDIAAHAWVEIDGRALNDTAGAAARFAAFPPHP